jgi:hypothetical protein
MMAETRRIIAMSRPIIPPIRPLEMPCGDVVAIAVAVAEATLDEAAAASPVEDDEVRVENVVESELELVVVEVMLELELEEVVEDGTGAIIEDERMLLVELVLVKKVLAGVLVLLTTGGIGTELVVMMDELDIEAATAVAEGVRETRTSETEFVVAVTVICTFE